MAIFPTQDVLRRQYESADVPNATERNFIFYEADFTDHASMIAIFERERPTVGMSSIRRVEQDSV